MRPKIKSITSATLLFVTFYCSCKKLADVPAPSYGIQGGNVYQSDQTAAGVLTGIYAKLSDPNNAFVGSQGMSLKLGLSSDELTLYSGANFGSWPVYYKNQMGIADRSSGSEFWTSLYNYIYICNSALEGLTSSSSLNVNVKQQLIGEAKFMRAFFYFYLVNMYGDVPLVLSSDYKVNASLPRTLQSLVYSQIITDLKDAESLLSSEYLNGGLQKYASSSVAERLRPTKWAAEALLARLYLFTGDWNNAELKATAVINNAALFNVASLDSVFLKNSKEAIWQLQPTMNKSNTEDANVFLLTSAGPNSSSNPVYLSSQLLNNFEIGDQRMVNGKWIKSVTVGGTTYYYPFKYKVYGASSVTEYFMIFRLAEQYLIRAEARVQQNNISGAQADLNIIRTRAGLSNTSANNKTTLLTAILNERQVELFTELGHRWLDLKRTGYIDTVMSIVTPIKANGANWKSYQQLYPLPWSDIQLDMELFQNAGYN